MSIHVGTKEEKGRVPPQGWPSNCLMWLVGGAVSAPLHKVRGYGGGCTATALPHLGQVTRTISHINIASFKFYGFGPTGIFVTNSLGLLRTLL